MTTLAAYVRTGYSFTLRIIKLESVLNVVFPTAGAVGSKLLIPQLLPAKNALQVTALVPADSSASNASFPAIPAPKPPGPITVPPALPLSFTKMHSQMELVSKK